MPDRTRARAVLAALLLAVTIVGIQAAGSTVDWVPPTRRVVITIGIVLEVVLAGLLVVVLRRGSRSGQPARTTEHLGASAPADMAERLRTFLSRILVTCLIVIPMAIVLASIRKPRIRLIRLAQPAPPLGNHHFRVPPAGSGAGGSIVLRFLQYGIVALLLAAIVAVVIAAWLRRAPRLPPAEHATDDPFDIPAGLARAVEWGRQALRELDDARAAIIGCYLAMERSLAEAGTARGVAETPDELLARAVAQDLVDGRPASLLTALFYEARFSSHPMSAAKRDQAERALAELAATLPADQPAAGSAPTAQANGTAR
jgi:hypothetical protein